jgi:DNA-binding MarR family transcriptional regulator
MSEYCNLGTKLRNLIDILDKDVELSYKELGLDNYKPKYTAIFRVLIANNAMSIGEIVKATGATQPGISQIVREMKTNGLVLSGAGKDAREKRISLTKKAQNMVATLEKQWKATQVASQSLNDELGLSLHETVQSAIAALEQKSFRLRIVESLGESLDAPNLDPT